MLESANDSSCGVCRGEIDVVDQVVCVTIQRFGDEIEKEESLGDREFAYEIKKQVRGRYTLFTINVNPGKLEEIDSKFHLNENLLRYLFVKLDEKNA